MDKPIMATFEEVFERIKAALLSGYPHVGLQYYAVATNLVDIYNFYVVPLSLYRLLPSLEKPGKRSENVKEYDCVIYNSAILDQYARGVVKTVHPDGSCTIFAMDYGVTDINVPQTEIFEYFHKEINEIPGFAQLCGLSMCYAFGGGPFSQESIDGFKFLMGQEREKLTITVKENVGNKLMVHVISSNSNPDNVSTSMAYAKLSALFACRP